MSLRNEHPAPAAKGLGKQELGVPVPSGGSCSFPSILKEIAMLHLISLSSCLSTVCVQLEIKRQLSWEILHLSKARQHLIDFVQEL